MTFKGSSGFKMTVRGCWTVDPEIIVESLSLVRRGRFRRSFGVTNPVLSSMKSASMFVSVELIWSLVDGSIAISGVFNQGTGFSLNCRTAVRRGEGESLRIHRKEKYADISGAKKLCTKRSTSSLSTDEARGCVQPIETKLSKKQNFNR